MSRHRLGAFAQLGNARAEDCDPVPAGMSIEEAAVFRGAYMTAYHALLQRGRMKAGDWVLINGAAGGIGIAAIQVAKLYGATVIATASTDEKRAACLEEGADYAIDYRAGLRDKVKELTGARDGVDIVYDPIGAEVFDESLRCLAWGGRILVLGFLGGGPSTPRTNYLLIKGLEVIGVRLGGVTEHQPEIGRENMRVLVELAAAGQAAARASRTASRWNARPTRSRRSSTARSSARRCWWAERIAGAFGRGNLRPSRAVLVIAGHTMEVYDGDYNAPDVTALRIEIERLQTGLNAAVDKMRELNGGECAEWTRFGARHGRQDVDRGQAAGAAGRSRNRGAAARLGIDRARRRDRDRHAVRRAARLGAALSARRVADAVARGDRAGGERCSDRAGHRGGRLSGRRALPLPAVAAGNAGARRAARRAGPGSAWRGLSSSRRWIACRPWRGDDGGAAPAGHRHDSSRNCAASEARSGRARRTPMAPFAVAFLAGLALGASPDLRDIVKTALRAIADALQPPRGARHS